MKNACIFRTEEPSPRNLATYSRKVPLAFVEFEINKYADAKLVKFVEFVVLDRERHAKARPYRPP